MTGGYKTIEINEYRRMIESSNKEVMDAAKKRILRMSVLGEPDIDEYGIYSLVKSEARREVYIPREAFAVWNTLFYDITRVSESLGSIGITGCENIKYVVYDKNIVADDEDIDYTVDIKIKQCSKNMLRTLMSAEKESIDRRLHVPVIDIELDKRILGVQTVVECCLTAPEHIRCIYTGTEVADVFNKNVKLWIDEYKQKLKNSVPVMHLSEPEKEKRSDYMAEAVRRIEKLGYEILEQKDNRHGRYDDMNIIDYGHSSENINKALKYGYYADKNGESTFIANRRAHAMFGDAGIEAYKESMEELVKLLKVRMYITGSVWIRRDIHMADYLLAIDSYGRYRLVRNDSLDIQNSEYWLMLDEVEKGEESGSSNGLTGARPMYSDTFETIYAFGERERGIV